MMNPFDKVKLYDGIFDRAPEKTPCEKVPDGPMFGNGDIGVVAGGSSDTLTFWLSKNDFWNYAATHSQEAKGGIRGLACFSLGSYCLKGGAFSARQKISTAQVSVDLEKEGYHLHVEAYAPRGENLMIVEAEAVKGSFPLTLKFIPLTDESAEYTHTFRNGLIHITKDYTHNVVTETRASGCCRVIGWDADSERLPEGGKFTAVISLFTNHDTDDHTRRAEEAVMQVTGERLSAMREKNGQWWSDFWSKSSVSIPSEPEIEKFWYGSHYLMACCCEQGKIAPGLFGNWVTVNKPAWAGDFHLNYNYQAPWWGVYSSNHVELSEPFDQPILDYIPTAQRHARELLACRGVYGKVGIGPMGYESSRMFRPDGTEDHTAPFWGQKSNAAYASVNMLMRFYSTWDATYARECVLPYLQEVALFWEDYLKFEDGRYVSYNDCIHENVYDGRYVFDWAKGAKDYGDDFNPIVSLGLIRMVFRGMLDVCGFLGIHEEKREKWEHILSHIAEYPTQERDGKTVFRYTERGMAWADGNSLGVQHIFPVGGVGLGSDEELLTVARNTVSAMGRWADYNAFPTFYAVAARVGYDPEVILTRLKEQIMEHSFPNYFIFYGGGGIECCSGVPGCVNEMLLQSHENVLRFFPVWEKSRDVAFENLRGYGAFLVSAALKDGKIGGIEITSEKGRPCAVLCPWEGGMTVSQNGRTVVCETEQTKDGVVYRFPTEPGAKYILS